MVFTFHTDPGHGWLEVPCSLLIKLGISDDITSFSYINGASAFLEEDCDAATFMRAYKDMSGGLPLIDEKYLEESPVRSYGPYHSFIEPGEPPPTEFVWRIPGDSALDGAVNDEQAGATSAPALNTTERG